MRVCLAMRRWWVVSSSSRYGQQLSKAWHYMFDYEPNYSAAYAIAIKAVELIDLPMMKPNGKKSTLSKSGKGHAESALEILNRGAGEGRCFRQCHPITYEWSDA